MVLKEILKNPPASTLIEDSWLQKGRPLFLSLIRHYSENGFLVRYFKYDSPLSNENDEMKQFNYFQHMQIIDGKKIKSFVSLDSCWSLDSKLDDDKDRVLVAIDSLSPLLLNFTIGDIATAISKFHGSKNISVIALVHSDVHNEQVLKALDYIFTCHLTLKKIQGHNVASGSWRKTSGKIIDSEEYYSINEKLDLKDVREVIETASSVIPESVSKSTVPKSTFKIGLNAREEEARSQVVLPYIRKTTETSTKTSQIIYEAEAPDWEDEDPDDDLEI